MKPMEGPLGLKIKQRTFVCADCGRTHPACSKRYRKGDRVPRCRRCAKC